MLITYRHFWPDSPPYASMLRSIAGRLTADGHIVTVLCEQPSYKPSDGKVTLPSFEEIDGIKVHRLARLPFWNKSGLVKSISKLVFPLRAYLFCIRNFGKNTDIDLVWTATIPPVLSGAIGLRLAKRYSAKFLYHCQDLYPEIAIHMKMVKANGLVAKIMTAVEKRTRQQADLVVSLSADMEKTVNDLVIPSKCHIVLNNFLLDSFVGTDEVQTVVKQSGAVFPTAETTNIIFAGNIGNYQGLDTIIKALVSLGDAGRSIHLTFMGEGKALAKLKEIAEHAPNISFIGHLPFDQAQPLIATADYGLVSLEPEIYKFAFPSKTLTYLGLSVPLVVIVEPDSDLVKTITSEKIGFYSKGNSESEVLSMLKEIASSTELKALHKSNAIKYYAESCARSHVLDTWSEVVANQFCSPTKEHC